MGGRDLASRCIPYLAGKGGLLSRLKLGITGNWILT